jgi:hypothetical protein
LLQKPAAFFYGASDISITTEEAAKLSRAPDENGKVFWPVRELSEGSLQAVWEAAQFPKPYRDPLAKEFSEAEKGIIGLFYSGLHENLEHRAMWHSAGGKLYPRRSPDETKIHIVEHGKAYLVYGPEAEGLFLDRRQLSIYLDKQDVQEKLIREVLESLPHRKGADVCKPPGQDDWYARYFLSDSPEIDC